MLAPSQRCLPRGGSIHYQDCIQTNSQILGYHVGAFVGLDYVVHRGGPQFLALPAHDAARHRNEGRRRPCAAQWARRLGSIRTDSRFIAPSCRQRVLTLDVRRSSIQRAADALVKAVQTCEPMTVSSGVRAEAVEAHAQWATGPSCRACAASRD